MNHGTIHGSRINSTFNVQKQLINAVFEYYRPNCRINSTFEPQIKICTLKMAKKMKNRNTEMRNVTVDRESSHKVRRRVTLNEELRNRKWGEKQLITKH